MKEPSRKHNLGTPPRPQRPVTTQEHDLDLLGDTWLLHTYFMDVSVGAWEMGLLVAPPTTLI